MNQTDIRIDQDTIFKTTSIHEVPRLSQCTTDLSGGVKSRISLHLYFFFQKGTAHLKG